MAALDLGEAHAVGVAQYRHNQAALGADGNADMVIVLVDDIVAVDLGVDRGDILQRLHRSLNEEAHQAELHAVLLLEGVAIVAAKLHYAAHIHVVERGEHGGAVLRLLESLGDGLAEPRHAHALFARCIVLGHGRTRRWWNLWLALAREQRLGGLCRNVLFQHLAAAARAFHFSRRYAAFGEQLAGSGRGRHIVAAHLLAAHRLALE